MKAKLSFLSLFCLALLLALPPQLAYSQICRVCKKPQQNCPYKMNHPKCATCGKVKEQCPYRGNHPTTGTLSITSTPSGAAIKIDGKYKGETPLTLENQRSGSYSIIFSAEGYETQTKSVTVTAGKTVTCSATLKKKQAQQPVVQQPVQQPTMTTPTPSSSSDETITVNGVSFKMIRVEGATTGTFYIGETEVTQALWEAVMGSNPSYFKGANRPVEKVSWNDCQTFITKLNQLTGKKFRLPTEAEWEYAAKGGNRSNGYTYSGSNNLDEVGWYYENSGKSRLDDSSWDVGKLKSNGCCTHPVKQKRCNELGIYDMSGNVLEWCEDLSSSSGSYRVRRGSCYSDRATYYCVANRGSNAPTHASSIIGFRLAQ